ncbi:prephenate dehydratase [Entomophthora muscae]|uniref:Prephenate dehydratase n=2 Tax=Entomophthora muscae TaxID=34485 RepID=A0ACC2UUB0_9FUNG|nr:prephenate dehydratase [Entomophthora muscae]
MSQTVDLENLRQKVGAVDHKIVSLLNERASLSQTIGEVKKAETNTAEIHNPGQEVAVFERIESINAGPLTQDSIRAIYREIMSASLSLQKELKIGFLGPKGTFTHQAALNRFGDSVSYVALESTRKVFSALEEGRISYAVLPLENSTTGIVAETIDAFNEFSQAKIRAESYMPVTQSLLSHFKPSGIRRIYSHRVAFGQCSKWLDTNFPGVERVSVSSTARAAEMASTEMYSAAICSEVCSKLYDIPVLNSNICDNQYNFTAFVVLGLTIQPETGKDKTLLSFTIDHRQPGALCDGLKVFKDHGLNLSKIETRPCPSKLKPFNYIFNVEFSGHHANEKVKEALESLQKFCIDLRILGSYPDERPEAML